MALGGCGLLCKYILFIFNLIFAVVGFAFLGLGLWLRFSNNTRGIFEVQLDSSTFVYGVTLLIALGSIMLIVVSFGDYGACSEKRCALQVFSVLVAILALAEVVVGVLVYSRSDEVGESIANFYGSMYNRYVVNGDPAMAVTLTFIHKVLYCCGVTGVPFLDLAKKTCPTPDKFMDHLYMPNCPEIIMNAFHSKAPVVMGIFIGTGALLITALVCSIILLNGMKKDQQAITTHYSTVY
ncbi:hypothetical protein PAMA_009153 [Pampus argenteus]